MFTDLRIAPVGSWSPAAATETRQGGVCLVPELNLISQLQALLHEGPSRSCVRCPRPRRWFGNYKISRRSTPMPGHVTFTVRSGRHDDLVLALAIAA